MNGRALSFLLLLTVFLAACLGSIEGSEAVGDSYSRIDVASFDELTSAADKPLIVDVRTPRECAKGVIPGAKQIDFSSPDFKERIAELDRTEPVAVYCAVGGRSKRAAEIMVGMGFEKVYDLAGGYNAWSKSSRRTASAEFTR